MAIDWPQLDRTPPGSSEAWECTQAGEVLRRDWFTPNHGPALKRHTGTGWELRALKHWDGVAHVHYGVLKRWDSGEWVETPTILTPPTPYVAPPPAPSITIPLDGYTTGLWGAYSLRRRLRTGYSGPILQARRSSDNAVMDIGLVGNYLDTNTLYAFLDNSQGFLTTIYDQSGAGNHFTQATATAQPKLSMGTPTKAYISFDGAGDIMQSPVFGSGASGATIFFSGNMPTTGDQALLESSANYNANSNTLLVYYAVAEGGFNVATHGVSSNYARSSFGDVRPSNNVHAYRIDRNAAAFIDKTSLFVDGIKQTRTGNADTGSISGGFSPNTLYWACRSGGALTSQLDAHDLCIYASALSDVDIAAVSTRLVG